MAERQYGKYIADIRSDHVERYEQASKKIMGNVLDAACGCGYGSYIMCLKNVHVKVTGVDINEHAIQYAKMHWQHHRNKFARWDLDTIEPKQHYDWIVCFELLQELRYPQEFLKNAAKTCTRLLCSVPSQDVITYDGEGTSAPYRHYTPVEIIDLLNDCGFGVVNVTHQKNDYGTIIIEAVSNVKA